MTLDGLLRDLGACHEAREWASQFSSLAEAWQACQRGDWMVWLVARMAGKPGWPTRQQIVLAVCACAAQALPLCRPQDRKTLQRALAVTRKWARGNATIAEVKAAAFDATAAAAAAYASGAYYYADVGYAVAGTANYVIVGYAATASESEIAYCATGVICDFAHAAAAAAGVACVESPAALAAAADICRRMLKVPRYHDCARASRDEAEAVRAQAQEENHA